MWLTSLVDKTRNEENNYQYSFVWYSIKTDKTDSQKGGYWVPVQEEFKTGRKIYKGLKQSTITERK